MKRIIVVMDVLTLFAFAGCQVVAQPATEEATGPYPTSSITLVAPSTATEAVLPTEAPALTFTASPTVPVTATETPGNSVLAEKGYDIADVRLSFPREDVLVVDFKYRIDESRTSRDTYIFMFIPPQCRDDADNYSTLHYVAKDLMGEAQLTFKMTIQGVCSADAIEFRFHSDPNWEANPPFYREDVLQPYRLVRDFPTLNSDTLSVENFQFTADVPWKGVFRFDYSISEEIPIPPEEYLFVVRGFGPDGGCAFWTQGPVITEHSGSYEVPLDLAYNLLFPYRNCLQGLENYTYTRSFLYLQDVVVDRDIYSQAITDSYTIWKSR